MDAEDLPNLQPKDFGYWDDPLRPILSFAWSTEGPHRIPSHRHPRAQITYPTSGVYRITTPVGDWVVPPGQAIWIPSNIAHVSYSTSAVNTLMLFVDESHTTSLPSECFVFSVSPLLEELLNKAIKYGNQYSPGGKESNLARVMLDELSELQAAPLHLPLAKDKRVQRIIEILISDPANTMSLDELAGQVGASERTVARIFSKETGMTFSEWRKQLRLLEAIDRLGQGQSVTQIALDLGYSNSSAFIAMFSRTLGMTPGQYFHGE